MISLSRGEGHQQTFGENACHPERSAGSGATDAEILRCAQHDSQDSGQGSPSPLTGEVVSPNVYIAPRIIFESF